MSAHEWPCLTTLSCTGKSGRAMQGVAGDARKAPTPPPPKHPKTHSSIHLLAVPCFRGVALHFVLLTGSSPFRARLFLPFIAACNPKHPFLSTPVLSIPLLCCGERAKARKAHTGSLECLQAIREMISAVKESLFQGRVNSVFILAFAARRD